MENNWPKWSERLKEYSIQWVTQIIEKYETNVFFSFQIS